MNIGINALFLEPGKVGGSETFAREWLKRIDNDLAKRDKIIVYCCRSFSKSVSYKNIIVKSVLGDSSNKIPRLFYEFFILPFLLIKDRVNILHSMGYTSPLFTHCPKVVNIFDTQFASVPYTLSFSTRLIYRILMPLIARRNNLVITISYFSKKEIMNHLGVSGKKIEVIYGAPDFTVKVLMRKDQKDIFIMTSSATHPHKNVDKLIKAFDILVRDSKFSNLSLFITGFPAKGHSEVLSLIDALKLKKQVKFLGWIKRGELVSLMRRSLLFVFPSVYEGFGLPPLEAMACGTPVLVSDKASLPEVVGNAAVIINPQDPTDIARKMKNVLTDESKYEELVKKGRARSAMFSWDKSYEELLSVYNKVNRL